MYVRAIQSISLVTDTAASKDDGWPTLQPNGSLRQEEALSSFVGMISVRYRVVRMKLIHPLETEIASTSQ